MVKFNSRSCLFIINQFITLLDFILHLFKIHPKFNHQYFSFIPSNLHHFQFRFRTHSKLPH